MAAPPPDNPARTPRNRASRVLILSGAVVVALLVAGSLWWSQARTTSTPSVAPAEAGIATMPVAAPVTGDASAGSGTAGDGSSTGSADSAVPPPTPPQRPTPKVSPGAPRASTNTSGRNLALTRMYGTKRSTAYGYSLFELDVR